MALAALEEAVFWSVFYGREVSRTALVAEFGVSPPTISRAVRRLLGRGLLSEAGATISARGRHPGLLRVNPHLALLLGLEIDRDRVRAAVTDFAGTPLGHATAACDARGSLQAALVACRQTAAQALEAAGVSLERIAHIGVGHTGTLDLESGVCLGWDGSPQWSHVPLRDQLRNLFGNKELTLDDRARAVALAQHLNMPAPSRRHSVLYVHAGTGIGAAIFVNGSLMRGATQGAGEIGHLVIDPDGPPCRCGNRGCVEAFASAEAVLRRVQERVQRGDSPLLAALCGDGPATLTLESLLAAARRGDPVAVDSLKEAGQALGIGIANAVQILNPSQVVLCGRFAYLARDFLFEPVCEQVRRLCLKNVSKALEVRLGFYRPDLGPVGCALLAAEQEASRLLRRGQGR
ncbi:MAG: ROK family protein [Bryobacteraceae bacterium]